MIVKHPLTTYTLVPVTGITPKEQQLVNDYWQATTKAFVNKPDAVAAKYKLSRRELAHKIKRLSHCLVHRGICEDCKTELTRHAYSQSELVSALRYPSSQCQACSEAAYAQSVKKDQEGLLPSDVMHLQAIASLSLAALSIVEYHLLTLIVSHQVHTSTQITDYLFQGDTTNKSSYWAALYGLGKKHIIQLTIEGNSLIKRIDYDNSLSQRLTQLEAGCLTNSRHTEIESSPVATFNPGQIRPKFTSVTMELDAAPPDYQGSFTVDKTLILCAGDKLAYQAYRDKEGNLLLAIQLSSDTPAMSVLPTGNTVYDPYEDKPPF